MTKLELRRSDIGFGRVVVDDRGVTRYGLIRSRHIAWDDIHEYRLSLELRGVTGDTGYIIAGPLTWIVDYAAARKGRHRLRFGLELQGNGSSVFFNWRFARAEVAIAAVLARIHARLTARKRDQLATSSHINFGPLAISKHAIQWRSKPPIPHVAVESVQLFDSSQVRLRVMQREKALPYGHAKLAEVPDVLSALELANELGYPVHGRELVRALTS